MRNLLLSFLLLAVILFSSGCAISGQKQERESWIKTSNDEFSVYFPPYEEDKDNSISSLGGLKQEGTWPNSTYKLEKYQVEGELPSTDYLVSSSRIIPEDESNRDQALKRAYDPQSVPIPPRVQQIAKDLNVPDLPEAKYTILEKASGCIKDSDGGSYPFITYHLRNEKETERGRVYLVGNLIYRVQMTRPGEEIPEKDFQEFVNGFSFEDPIKKQKESKQLAPGQGVLPFVCSTPAL